MIEIRGGSRIRKTSVSSPWLAGWPWRLSLEDIQHIPDGKASGWRLRVAERHPKITSEAFRTLSSLLITLKPVTSGDWVERVYHEAVSRLGNHDTDAEVRACAEKTIGDLWISATDLLKTKVLPLSLERGDRWMGSWAFWMLKRRDLAVRIIVTPLLNLDRARRLPDQASAAGAGQ